MIYFLDTADTAAIARLADLYPIAGVTTNPTLIAREKRPFADIIKDIRAVIGDGAMLHVQVTGNDADTMVAEARKLADFVGAGFHPKVPVTAEGIKAIRRLSGLGFRVTATAIVTAQQALMAAVAGAAFTAPYVNRLDMIGGDGVRVVADIVHLFRIHALPTRLLTASFKNVQQVHDIAMAGAHSATLPPDILEALIRHPLTDSGIAGFAADWAAAYGEGRTTADLI
ncbi:transaldolase [Pleomorphomonas diazotrophica]|uniref:Transaldolase n=1 Tax=Pleomorphomonas diazotrophica TaxID=1166257 RepID=A0A1I4TAY8_9HYPH|nr:transaldolase family protein [Pleomorphomonas diazotrophica]PKR89445.1 transaldolase [Pleomorphomonas diazotrophica]SFM73882.1 fructose-6-phosphate aldolase 2 [Pleomorphomonas diazotrophica]